MFPTHTELQAADNICSSTCKCWQVEPSNSILRGVSCFLRPINMMLVGMITIRRMPSLPGLRQGTELTSHREKARIPAWCDRILWKGPGLRQQNYDASGLRCSDHRPVWATFTCIINVVDEALKSKLRRHIYSERQNDPHSLPVNRMNQVGSESDDHISPDSIAPGLPPASSDNQKWWLETGTRLLYPLPNYVSYLSNPMCRYTG